MAQLCWIDQGHGFEGERKTGVISGNFIVVSLRCATDSVASAAEVDDVGRL